MTRLTCRVPAYFLSSSICEPPFFEDASPAIYRPSGKIANATIACSFTCKSSYPKSMTRYNATMSPKKGGHAVPLARPRVRRGNEEDAEKLRKELLVAASGLFAKGGLDAVTVRAVAARVGVSPMTPYRYFADKAELLAGLWQFVIRALYERIATAVAIQTGARARLRVSLDAFLSYWETNPDHYRLVYMTDKTTKREQTSALTQVPVYGEILALAKSVVRDISTEIGAQDTHVALAVDIMFAMLLGFLHGTLVNQRYPWSNLRTLRAAYIEQIVATVDRCLLYGPRTTPGVPEPDPPSSSPR